MSISKVLYKPSIPNKQMLKSNDYYDPVERLLFLKSKSWTLTSFCLIEFHLGIAIKMTK